MKKVNLKSLVLCIALALAGAFYSCDNDEVVPAVNENEDVNKPQLNIALSTSEQITVTNTNDFGLNLFKVMSADVGEKNLFFSPLVSSLNLALLANGSAGDTRAEILNALGVDDSQIAHLNTALNKIITSLPDADNKSSLTLASSLWLSDRCKPTAAFQSICADTYRSAIFNYPFGSTTLAANINDWCSKNTGGAIKQLVTQDEVAKSTFNILNATSFYGEWTKPFDTVDRYDFYLSNGGKYKVPVMAEYSNYFITYNETLSMLFKSFGNKSFCIGLILPHEEVSLSDAISSLDIDSWNELRSCGESDFHKVVLIAPKLDITATYDMLPYYKSMGIATALTRDADFSEIGVDAALSLSLQKAHFSMDEKGAKAEVVEIVSDGPTSPGWLVFKEYVLNRPFAFVIFEQSTGTIMFAGKVEYPQPLN